ncbi:MAG: hypothetical protein ACI3YT_04680 [Prevotella sp.]
MMKTICQIILLVFSVAVSHATNEINEMHQLTVSDGLSGNSVGEIIKGKNGKVWLMTSFGIDSFDGKNLYSYDISVFGKPHNTVIDICEGKNGEIYAATRDGLCVLELGHNHFAPIKLDIREPLCLYSDNEVLYIGSREGLYVYEKGKVRMIPIDKADIGIGNAVRAIRKSSDGQVFFVTRYGLYCHNPKTGKTRKLNTDVISEKKISFGQFDIKGKCLYLGTKTNGLFKYDLRTSKIDKVAGIGNIVVSVHAGEGNELYVATDGTGAYCLDASNDSITDHYGTDGNGSHHLPINTAYCYKKDQNGVNWFGLSRHGMVYSYRKNQLFKPVRDIGLHEQGHSCKKLLYRN